MKFVLAFAIGALLAIVFRKLPEIRAWAGTRTSAAPMASAYLAPSVSARPVTPLPASNSSDGIQEKWGWQLPEIPTPTPERGPDSSANLAPPPGYHYEWAADIGQNVLVRNGATLRRKSADK